MPMSAQFPNANLCPPKCLSDRNARNWQNANLAAFRALAGAARPSVSQPLVLFERQHEWKWQWSDIEWCKLWNTCAPKAVEGSQPDAPATHPDDILHEALEQCAREAKADAEYCVRIAPHRLPEYEREQTLQCAKDALAKYKACETTAIDACRHW
jgi:hypothetical protein